MRYLGGKTRIAKQLAEVIDRTRKPGQLVWDAFCGGLSMSVALSKNGPVWSTDVNAALINLYLAVQRGWVPPSNVSEEQWRAAKLLPDTDPLKAFCGFGCSFGGKWFGGYARANGRNWADEAKRGVLSDVKTLQFFRCVQWLDVNPEPLNATLYLDPPYAGTQSYRAVAPFDSKAFFIRAAHWALYTDVFISEYESPIGVCVWEKLKRKTVSGKGEGEACPVGLERLYHLPKGSRW